VTPLRSKSGLLNYRDGNVRPARYYYGDGEDEPQNHEHRPRCERKSVGTVEDAATMMSNV
jgi:hypothetical protein